MGAIDRPAVPGAAAQLRRMLLRAIRLSGDDRAQGMTEFVIVIPVVLYFFFALIQLVLIAQVAQLGNYAAYMAGRVYAVQAWEGHEDEAESLAKKAAALAYAPVAQMIPGEAFSFPTPSSLLPGYGSSYAGNLLNQVGRLAEGFAMAYAVRTTIVGGGSIEIEKEGDPEQVMVDIVYSCPIWVPGLRGLWALATRGQGIETDLEPLSSGLSVLTFTSDYPYIGIRSKAAMGYEPWEGPTPRKAKSVESGSEADPELEAQEQEIKDAQERVETAKTNMDNAKTKLEEAQTKLDEAQAHLNEVLADPDSTQADIDSATQARDAARAARDQARDNYREAAEEFEEASQALQDLSPLGG